MAERGATLPAGLVRALAGAGVRLLTDPDVVAGYGVDWTGRWRGQVLGVAIPGTVAQVGQVLSGAREHGVAVQVQGGNTGLVGGSVPDRPALVLSTRGLDGLGAVDPVERTVRVGAGVTVGRLAAHAHAAGLRFGVDLAARDSATVGGMAATNAGGISVVAHGMMREQVRGLTAVLADGRVIRTTGRPRKDNAGYDLTGLLVGSEGTLGVICEVEVRLLPDPGPTTVAVLEVGSLAEAVAAARAVQGWGTGAGAASALLAAEVVDAAGMAHASRALGHAPLLPAAAPWALLLEVADGATGQGLAAVAERVVAVATDPAGRSRLWAHRERQTELMAAERPNKLDVSLRLARLDEGVAAIRAAAGAASVRIFGHALDGNLHVQLFAGSGVPGDDRRHDGPGADGAGDSAAHAVLAVVAQLGGSISAEHGIGRQKAAMLPRVRSAEEIAWMRQVHASVNPGGILNAGVLFTAP